MGLFSRKPEPRDPNAPVVVPADCNRCGPFDIVFMPPRDNLDAHQVDRGLMGHYNTEQCGGIQARTDR